MKQGDWYLSETRRYEKIICVYDEKCHASYPPLAVEECVATVPNLENSAQYVALITAAPDLLAALQGLMHKDSGEPAFVVARAAIEKAVKL